MLRQFVQMTQALKNKWSLKMGHEVSSKNIEKMAKSARFYNFVTPTRTKSYR